MTSFIIIKPLFIIIMALLMVIIIIIIMESFTIIFTIKVIKLKNNNIIYPFSMLIVIFLNILLFHLDKLIF